MLPIVYTSLIVLSSWDFAFMWHEQLKYIGLDKVKKALKRQCLNSQKVALIKSWKVYGEAK